MHNVIQLGAHANIHTHISPLPGSSGRRVSIPSITQIRTPTSLAHLPAYFHVQYHVPGNTAIIWHRTMYALRASLSWGNRSCAQ